MSSITPTSAVAPIPEETTLVVESRESPPAAETTTTTTTTTTTNFTGNKTTNEPSTAATEATKKKKPTTASAFRRFKLEAFRLENLFSTKKKVHRLTAQQVRLVTQQDFYSIQEELRSQHHSVTDGTIRVLYTPLLQARLEAMEKAAASSSTNREEEQPEEQKQPEEQETLPVVVAPILLARRDSMDASVHSSSSEHSVVTVISIQLAEELIPNEKDIDTVVDENDDDDSLSVHDNTLVKPSREDSETESITKEPDELVVEHPALDSPLAKEPMLTTENNNKDESSLLGETANHPGEMEFKSTLETLPLIQTCSSSSSSSTSSCLIDNASATNIADQESSLLHKDNHGSCDSLVQQQPLSDIESSTPLESMTTTSALVETGEESTAVQEQLAISSAHEPVDGRDGVETVARQMSQEFSREDNDDRSKEQRQAPVERESVTLVVSNAALLAGTGRVAAAEEESNTEEQETLRHSNEHRESLLTNSEHHNVNVDSVPLSNRSVHNVSTEENDNGVVYFNEPESETTSCAASFTPSFFEESVDDDEELVEEIVRVKEALEQAQQLEIEWAGRTQKSRKSHKKKHKYFHPPLEITFDGAEVASVITSEKEVMVETQLAVDHGDIAVPALSVDHDDDDGSIASGGAVADVSLGNENESNICTMTTSAEKTFIVPQWSPECSDSSHEATSKLKSDNEKLEKISSSERICATPLVTPRADVSKSLQSRFGTRFGRNEDGQVVKKLECKLTIQDELDLLVQHGDTPQWEDMSEMDRTGHLKDFDALYDDASIPLGFQGGPQEVHSTPKVELVPGKPMLNELAEIPQDEKTNNRNPKSFRSRLGKMLKPGSRHGKKQSHSSPTGVADMFSLDDQQVQQFRDRCLADDEASLSDDAFDELLEKTSKSMQAPKTQGHLAEQDGYFSVMDASYLNIEDEKPMANTVITQRHVLASATQTTNLKQTSSEDSFDFDSLWAKSEKIELSKDRDISPSVLPDAAASFRESDEKNKEQSRVPDAKSALKEEIASLASQSRSKVSFSSRPSHDKPISPARSKSAASATGKDRGRSSSHSRISLFRASSRGPGDDGRSSSRSRMSLFRSSSTSRGGANEESDSISRKSQGRSSSRSRLSLFRSSSSSCGDLERSKSLPRDSPKRSSSRARLNLFSKHGGDDNSSRAHSTADGSRRHSRTSKPSRQSGENDCDPVVANASHSHTDTTISTTRLLTGKSLSTRGHSARPESSRSRLDAFKSQVGGNRARSKSASRRERVLDPGLETLQSQMGGSGRSSRSRSATRHPRQEPNSRSKSSSRTPSRVDDKKRSKSSPHRESRRSTSRADERRGRSSSKSGMKEKIRRKRTASQKRRRKAKAMTTETVEI